MASEESESRIGKGAKINGKLQFSSSVRLEGEIEGEISGKEIVVAESAVVNAKLIADRLVVAGTLNGEVVAHQMVELLASARAQGTLRTPKLILHEGAVFEGDCKMPRDRIAA